MSSNGERDLLKLEPASSGYRWPAITGASSATPLRGVRISWLPADTNALFARLAARPSVVLGAVHMLETAGDRDRKRQRLDQCDIDDRLPAE